MAVIITRPTAKPLLAYGDPTDTPETMRVTSPFGPRSDGYHAALDIGNYVAGDLIVAAAPGRVIGVGYLLYPWSTPDTRWGTGNTGGLMIVIQHTDHVYTVYAHMRAERVSLGDSVARGQVIGEIGDSGSARGQPHLHFAVVAASNSQLDNLKLYRRTVPPDYCRDPWPLITKAYMLTDGGATMAYNDSGSDEDMRFPSGYTKVFNRQTTIEARTDRIINIRSVPPSDADDVNALPPETILTKLDTATAFHVRGYVDRASGRWYGGELWVRGWVFAWVHSALCSDLRPIEETNTGAVELVNKIRELVA